MASFSKKERKLSVTVRDQLFKEGTVLFYYPYKIFYMLDQADAASAGCSIVISVPKRNFSRAVDRNRIKRQIREAYRLNNSLLNNSLHTHCMRIHILCLYLPDEHTATALLFHKMESLMAKFAKIVAQSGALSAHRAD